MSFIPTREQEEIFNFFKKSNENGMIDAVAGSGKTSTIIKGIDYIPNNNSILFCAFNKKIQEEIKQKTKKYDNVFVRTTYSLGLKILKENYFSFKKQKVNTSKYFSILQGKLRTDSKGNYLNKLDLIDDFENIKKIYYKEKDKEEQDLFYKTFYSNCFRLIDLLRYTLSYGKTVEVFKSLINRYAIEIDTNNSKLVSLYFSIINELIKEGNSKAIKFGIFDFADMIFLPCELKLASNVKYDVVFIDECQDLSNAQLKIINKFRKKEGRIFAVGDPYQSIYGFAGASPESFNNIKNFFKPKMFKLTNCFRCSKSIVELAKKIRSDIETKNKDEGVVINIKYEELLNYVKANDFILSRGNSDLFEVLFLLLTNNIKCNILGRQEILAQLKKIIPDKKFNDPKYYEELPFHLNKIYKSKEKKLGNDPGNYEKLANIKDAIDILEICFFNIEGVLTLNALFKHIEQLMSSKNEDAVILSSIHRAKGLEADRVFIIGYNKLPIEVEGMSQWQKYQENCLKYVAITRAEKTLFLTTGIPEDNNNYFIENNDISLSVGDEDIF